MAKILNIYKSYCKRFGGFFKSKPSEELRFAVNFLGWGIKPEKIIGAGIFSIFLGFFLIAIFSIMSFLIGMNPTIYFFFSPLSIFVFFLIT